MRKRLAAVAIAAISASGIFLTSAPAALADTSACGGEPDIHLYTCSVTQTTAAGEAAAYSTFDGNNGLSFGSFYNSSGYTMDAWINIDYGNGYETVWSAYDVASNDEWLPTPTFDDSGYLTQACFQFTSWSGAAVHCTAGV